MEEPSGVELLSKQRMTRLAMAETIMPPNAPHGSFLFCVFDGLFLFLALQYFLSFVLFVCFLFYVFLVFGLKKRTG